jgi:transcriptional regulator with XRE-family HTH domain
MCMKISAEGFASEMGRLVREAREGAGMSQLAVGREAGLPGATLARLERGEAPDLSVYALRRVADALGVGVALLVPSAAGEGLPAGEGGAS